MFWLIIKMNFCQGYLQNLRIFKTILHIRLILEGIWSSSIFWILSWCWTMASLHSNKSWCNMFISPLLFSISLWRFSNISFCNCWSSFLCNRLLTSADSVPQLKRMIAWKIMVYIHLTSTKKNNYIKTIFKWYKNIATYTV